MKRRAFTVIELMVVIAIIALLGSLLVMAIGKLIRTQKGNATKADLENTRSMLDEMNATSHILTRPNASATSYSPAPIQWLWRNQLAGTFSIGPAQGLVNFWYAPALTTDPSNPANQISDCLEAPFGALTTDSASTAIRRNASRAVLNTQLVMRILLAYPANKAAFSQLPADRWMIPAWQIDPLPPAPVVLGPTGSNGIPGDTDDGSDTNVGVIYAINNTVQDLDQTATPQVMRTYRCVTSHVASAGNEPYKDTAHTDWVPDSNPTPILLDAWSNPLIFVPGSGLIAVRGNVGTGDLNIAVLAGTPLPAGYSRTLPPIQSPDNRPFFASAGPDGDLSTGDDNLYSFEK